MLTSVFRGDALEAQMALDRWADPHVPLLKRRERSAARAALRGMLESTTGEAATAWRIVALQCGRPVAVLDDGRIGPFVSISHSRGWVACAVAEEGPVGIDIEVARDDRDHAGLAAAAFGPRECVRASAGNDAFYRLWTLREARAKATGMGLAEAADRQDRFEDGPDEGCWLSQQDGALWFLMHHRSHPNLALSLAAAPSSARSNVAPSVAWWSPSGASAAQCPMEHTQIRRTA